MALPRINVAWNSSNPRAFGALTKAMLHNGEENISRRLSEDDFSLQTIICFYAAMA